MKKVIKYKIFVTAEEFEDWQYDYINKTGTMIQINQVVPIALNLQVSDSSESSTSVNMDGNLAFGCFVTYIEDF